MKGSTPRTIHWFPSRGWFHGSRCTAPKLKAALIKGELRKHDAERRGSSAGAQPWDEVVMLSKCWCCRRSTISPTIRQNTSFATATHLVAFLAWVSKMRFLTPKLSGSIVKRWRKRAWWKNCLICSMGSERQGLSRPWAGRSSTRRSSRRPSSTIRARRTKTIKDGETPEDWKRKPPRTARRTRTRAGRRDERSYFGYKNHIGVDRRHKFVRRYVVSDASVHDSQKLEDVLDASNTASDVWADSAYRSQEIEKKLAERGLKSRIHRRAYRNRQLSEAQKAANKMRSKACAPPSMCSATRKTAWERELFAPSESFARGARSE